MGTTNLALNKGISDNRCYLSLHAHNQPLDDQKMISGITSIFHCVNPSLSSVTGNINPGSSFRQCFDNGPRWIFSNPGIEGKPHPI